MYTQQTWVVERSEKTHCMSSRLLVLQSGVPSNISFRWQQPHQGIHGPTSEEVVLHYIISPITVHFKDRHCAINLHIQS